MKTPLIIYAEATPNPATMKFVLNIMLIPENSAEYLNKEAADGSPLAAALFDFDFVKGIYITKNYITVTKREFISWSEIIPQVRAFVKEWIESGKDVITYLPAPVSSPVQDSAPKTVTDIQQIGIENQIIDILDEYVKPAVENDGGEISFLKFENGVVTVQLKGSCSGCPSSTVTLKSGIETMLKKMVPGVNEVVAENA